MLTRSDARHLPLADNTVQCVVTSPPYWGLRKYAGEQELVWEGSRGCGHEWAGINMAFHKGQVPDGKWKNQTSVSEAGNAMSNTCSLCGAWRGAYGLEPTIEMYVQHSILILKEIRRVLKPDGVCFWNIGDSYSSQPGQRKTTDKAGKKQETNAGASTTPSRCDPGLKSKDLCLIPARIALAAQADGWWVRSDIIWSKPNPMPESVRDRPTDAYEHILMLTKSARYYWNAEAVKEERQGNTHSRGTKRTPPIEKAGIGHERWCEYMTRDDEIVSRNLRNVWTFATQPYKGAHFATFPAELVIRCLEAAARPGDLVLDPFAGSGTVGLVAFNMGRRFVLCDLAYQDLQRERVPPMALNGML
jgi:DNA modification methylase